MTALGYYDGKSIVTSLSLVKNQQVIIIPIESKKSDVAAGYLSRYAENAENKPSDGYIKDAAVKRYEQSL